MNAKPNFADITLSLVLKKIFEAKESEPNSKSISINLICEPDDSDTAKEYKHVLEFLKQRKIIKGLKHEEGVGYLPRDEYGWEPEMYFYTPEFSLNNAQFNKFLVETSRAPKYSLQLDEKRRLILNNKYIITTVQFDSTNRYFLDHCLKLSRGLITQEELVKLAGKKELPRFHSILSNLKISPNLVSIFFPHVSKGAAEFRNNVTVKDITDSNINEVNISNFIKKLKHI